MMCKEIYILHEYGSNSHYRALNHLCDEKGIDIIYREFSITKSIIKSIIRLDMQLLKKQMLNIIFLFSLIFSKNKTIVLGIAPYDYRLIFLSLILNKHKVYYHTSWTCWDKSFYPKKLFVNRWLISFWESYIKNKVLIIFTASLFTKKELIKNLNLDNKRIIVVNHSYDEKIYNFKSRTIKLNFIYVGRFEPQKGILEILEYFTKNNNLNLTLVGNGSLVQKVKEYSNINLNIRYIGYISDQKKLAEIYNENDFLLLNSKKMANWEELFGMVIIEAMACGIIPISTNHKGPNEIISNGIDGFLSAEKEYMQKIDEVINNLQDSKNKFEITRMTAIESAKKYSTKEIAKRWESVFE